MIDGLRYVNSDRFMDVSSESLIDEVLPPRIVREIYAVWDGPKVDFGGGVFGVTCVDLLTHCDESWRKLRKITGLKIKDAKEAITLCREALEREPYV